MLLPCIWAHPHNLWLPSCSVGKESARNAGDLGLIPGLGRSPGEGKGYTLQYSGLENSMDCTVHGVAKSQTQLNNFQFTSPQSIFSEANFTGPQQENLGGLRKKNFSPLEFWWQRWNSIIQDSLLGPKAAVKRSWASDKSLLKIIFLTKAGSQISAHRVRWN